VKRLLKRRFFRPGFRQIRCAVCYRRLWPWQARARGANYFPHPWMLCHLACGKAKELELTGTNLPMEQG